MTRALPTWLRILVTLALCAAYACQVVPHAHATADTGPHPTPPAHTHHNHHSHSAGDHHHDPPPPDDRAHHHHSLSWHLDLHFARVFCDGFEAEAGDAVDREASATVHVTDTPLAAWHAPDVDPRDSIPIASLHPRGPPPTS